MKTHRYGIRLYKNTDDWETFYATKNGVRFADMHGWDFANDQNWSLVLLIWEFARENSSAQRYKLSTRDI